MGVKTTCTTTATITRWLKYLATNAAEGLSPSHRISYQLSLSSHCLFSHIKGKVYRCCMSLIPKRRANTQRVYSIAIGSWSVRRAMGGHHASAGGMFGRQSSALRTWCAPTLALRYSCCCKHLRTCHSSGSEGQVTRSQHALSVMYQIFLSAGALLLSRAPSNSRPTS
jgi:hypothetical protein